MLSRWQGCTAALKGSGPNKKLLMVGGFLKFGLKNRNMFGVLALHDKLSLFTTVLWNYSKK